MAEPHIEPTTACETDWHRAEMLLKRVLELSPDCSRAMSLLTPDDDSGTGLSA